jgi:hypothetical protein
MRVIEQPWPEGPDMTKKQINRILADHIGSRPRDFSSDWNEFYYFIKSMDKEAHISLYFNNYSDGGNTISVWWLTKRFGLRKRFETLEEAARHMAHLLISEDDI